MRDLAKSFGTCTGTRPEVTHAVTRGAARTLHARGFAVLAEVALANQRRADLFGIGRDGEIVIIEVKSSREDFMVDTKWPEYRAFCDALYFAVAPDFPRDLLPGDAGLLIADAFGGDIVQEAPRHRLAPARRKALTLRAARLASMRLCRLDDPEAAMPGELAF